MQKDLEGKDVRDRDIPTDRKAECVCCGDKKREDELYPSMGTEDGLVCEGCLSDDQCEPAATVVYGPDENEDRATIGSFHDETEGTFRVKWVSTDAWRGYYSVESDEYVKVHTDCILSYSEDEAELKNFDDMLREYCDTHDIRYARVFTRTSNVFSAGYDFFVAREDVAGVEDFVMLHKALADLNSQYRDPERFALTALTGKSGNFDEQDRLLVKAEKMLRNGEDPDVVMEFIRDKAQNLK